MSKSDPLHPSPRRSAPPLSQVGRGVGGESKRHIRSFIKHTSRMMVLMLTLAACAAQPAAPAVMQQPTEHVTSPTAQPARSIEIDEHVWKILYRRGGWAGSASADLRAVGDVMLGRGVADVAQKHGRAYPFAATHALLDGDLTLGNLESPLTDRTEPLRPGPYQLPASTAFAPELQAAGFDALSLANNHALDVGPQGLQDAANALHGAGIAPLGVGPNDKAARTPTVIQASGQRVALLAFNAVADPEDQPNESSNWGRAWLDDAALQTVQQARHAADTVIVMVHWGAEYAAAPTAVQHEWARKLVGAGADVIIGAHPHVLQPVEQVESDGRSGVVAYSLGNFIFDQSFSQDTSTSTVLRVLLDEHGVALVAAAPVEIVAGQPRPLALDAQAAQTALATLGMPKATPLQAWRWDGKAAEPVSAPPDLRLISRPTAIAVDLRGDGQPLHATLDSQGHVEVLDKNTVVWQNEEPNWHVTRMDSGDPNDDGRMELVLLLWKPDEHGVLRSHPFLMGWRGGHYRIIWGGSATTTPIQDLAVGDLDGDGRQELVVLEGGAQPGDAATNISVWHWHGWGFEREWTSAAGQWRDLALVDISGDGRLDIVAHSDR